MKACSVAAIALLAAQSVAAAPTTPPTAAAAALEQAPILDGNVIGDPAWSSISPASDFWQIQPNDGEPSTQRTDVYIGYTDTAMYIGVVAWDDNPSGIIVSDSRRDSDLDDTDAFLFIIDGQLDRQNGYVFGTNAAGIEYDAQVTRNGGGGSAGFGSSGANLNWDGSWSVQAQISDIGWSAEFEIPFTTLRYGVGDEQTWGINFQRNIRRNNEITFWAPLERNRSLNRVSDAGTLTGVVPPSRRNLQITPYALGVARRGGALDGTDSDYEAGVDLKYSITPSLTLDLTVNTDFAQVEADEQQINLDRFNLFFPELRPFFLENAGQFSVGNAEEVELFFSRRIGIGDDGEAIPVEAGARVSGKIGDSTNVGFLYMGTEAVEGIAPENRYGVARISQELPNRSSVGAIVVTRDGDGSFGVPSSDDYNRTYAIDGRWGIGDNVTLEGWAAKTDTPGLTGSDDAFSFEAGYSSGRWASSIEYTEVGTDFNPEVGFLSRTDYRKGRVFLMRRIRPDDLWGLLEIRPHVSYTGFWKSDDFQESGFLHMDTHWEFRTGTELHTGVNFTRDGVIDDFEISDGVIVPAGTYDHSESQIVFFTNRSRPFSFRIRSTIGGRFGGDRVSLSPTLRYRYQERFRSELSINYNDFDLPGGSFTATLARLRMSYSFTPNVQLQALIQYNESSDEVGTNLRFSWLQNANSGLYLVYNEVDDRTVGALPTGRELILKYSYIFDVFNGG